VNNWERKVTKGRKKGFGSSHNKTVDGGLEVEMEKVGLGTSLAVSG